jgi:acetylornithine deacetylase
LIEEKIINKVEEKREEIVDLLTALIRIPSLTGEEGEAQSFVANQYTEMNLEVDVWEPDIEELFHKFPEVAQYPSHWKHDLILPYHNLPTYEDLAKSGKMDILNYKNRPNVVGTWKGSGGGRSLIVNGHIDTVSVEPRDKWTHDPFGAEIEDGKMYGRGTSDMKSGIVAAAVALECLIEMGVKLRGDVILESVVNEEHAGNGTLACISRGYRADAAIVGEPSENMVRVATYGGVYWGINLTGRALHTFARWEGNELKGLSANEKLPVVINHLLELESVQNKKPVSDFYAGKKPFALNIGRVWGGDYDTTSAASCSLRGSIYFSPDIGSVKEVIDSVREYVRKAADEDPWLRENPPETLFFHHDDAHWGDPKAEIVKTILASGEKTLGQKPQIIAGRGANDCRHLVNQGKIPSAVFGPGTWRQAHVIDEWTKIDDLISNVKALALAIYYWCR